MDNQDPRPEVFLDLLAEDLNLLDVLLEEQLTDEHVADRLAQLKSRASTGREAEQGSSPRSAGQGVSLTYTSRRLPPLVDISGSTRVFYSRRGIQITDRWFATNGKRYALRDLQDIREAREPLNPVAFGAALGALGTAIAGVVVVLVSGNPASLVASLSAAGALLLAALGSILVRPRHRLVLATVLDFDVVLFATRDNTLQSQVHRALDRAMRAATSTGGDAGSSTDGKPQTFGKYSATM